MTRSPAFAALAALLPLLAGAVASANPDRREPHLNWREAHLSTTEPELERWFMPTALGHEPGPPPPPDGLNAFLTRIFHGVSFHDGGEWQRRNQVDAGLAFSHNLSRIFPPELFDERPELFALIDGRRERLRARNIPGNPELGGEAPAVHAAAAARAFFAKNPDAVSFSVGTNDAVLFSDSEETRRHVYPPRYFREMPIYTDLVFAFTNRVAELTDDLGPDKHIGALAYYWTEHPPSFPIHPRVIPFLTADRSQMFDRDFRREERDVMRAWANSGAERVGLYDYVYGYGFLVPRLYPTTLARHLREARRLGFTDYFAEFASNWGLDGPQPWLAAQLLRDPEQSARRLLAEYYRRFYRDAARPMRAFFEECEAVWAAQGEPVYWLKHYRNDSQAALFPAEVRRRLRARLDAAERAAADDPLVAARVAVTSAAFRVSERYVEMQEAREALARAVIAAESAASPDLAAADLAALGRLRDADRAARAAFRSTLAEVRRTQPLALAPRIPIDFERSDWGPSADRLLAGDTDLPGDARELLHDPEWRGTPRPDLHIAGLLYEPGLTRGWSARTEPREGLLTELRDPGDGGPRALRFEHNKTTGVDQVVPLPPGPGGGVAACEISGEISLTNQVIFRVLWFGANHALLREDARQIPPGSWRGAHLRTPLDPPEGAAFVGIMLNIQHQQPGDWLEWRGASIRWRVLTPPVSRP